MCIKILSNYSKRVKRFSEFGPRQSLDQWQMAFDNPLGYILWLSMCKQKFVTIFHSVILQSLGPDLVNINVYIHAKVYQNILNGLRVVDIFRELSRASRTDRGRTSVIIGHTVKVNLQLLCRSTFYGSCNVWPVRLIFAQFRCVAALCDSI